MDCYRTRKEGTYTDDACMTNTVVQGAFSFVVCVTQCDNYCTT